MSDQPSGNVHEQAKRIAWLINGYLQKSLTTHEHNELDEWVQQSDENMLLFEQLTDEKYTADTIRFLQQVDSRQALLKVQQKIAASGAGKRGHAGKFRYYSVAAAVIFLLGVSIVVYRIATFREPGSTELTLQQDIDPGSRKAELILADGQSITLDASTKGKITAQGNSNIENNGRGMLIYQNDSLSKTTEPLYNTLRTPRGGEYQLMLPDGSRVWLNASSSIRYPASFPGDLRQVEITGEVYFEIIPDKKAPFRVKINKETIEVLGTSFNVNMYPDEPVIRTTLVEGSIKISGREASRLLQAGEQMQWNQFSGASVSAASIEETLGWKNGMFVFENASIESIMRQVSRWYDVQVEFNSTVSHHFNATIPRSVSVSRLLRLLELTDRVHFKIEKNKIIVSV